MTFLKRLLTKFKRDHVSTFKFGDDMTIRTTIHSHVSQEVQPFLLIIACVFYAVRICRKLGLSDKEISALVKDALPAALTTFKER